MSPITIGELIETVLRHEVADVEIECEGVKVRIRTAAAIPPPKPVENDVHFVVRAPVAGRFHRANGDNKPLVSEGETIELGRVLCVIDNKGQINAIEAEIDGTLSKIFVENLEPVEAGQALFGIQSVK